MPDLLAAPALTASTARHGETSLSLRPVQPLTLIAPFPGRTRAVSDLVRDAVGVPLPLPGETTMAGEAELRWAGRDQTLVLGTGPTGLGEHAAVIDVSDVYVQLRLSGSSSVDVLARLVPIDLRDSQFPQGRTAKTLLGHIAAQITAVDDGFDIMVMRSFAHSAFHEIEIAMAGVAGRKQLAP